MCCRDQLARFENGQAVLKELTGIDRPHDFKSRVNLRPASMLLVRVDNRREAHRMLVQCHYRAEHDPSLVVSSIAMARVLGVECNSAIVITLQIVNAFRVASAPRIDAVQPLVTSNYYLSNFSTFCLTRVN